MQRAAALCMGRDFYVVPWRRVLAGRRVRQSEADARRSPGNRRALWDEISPRLRAPPPGRDRPDHQPAPRCEAPLAAPHFEQSIAILQQINAENELALAYAGYGRLHQQQGHVTQAREYLTRALEIFERLGTLGEPDKVRQALADLPTCFQGDPTA